MYGIYANIWGIWMVNVTIYSIHGSYGLWKTPYGHLLENIRSIDANPGNCHKHQLGHHFSAAVHDAHLMKPGGGKPVGTMICGYRKKRGAYL